MKWMMLLLIGFTSLSISAQDGVSEKVNAALNSGNAKAFAQLFVPNVDMTLVDDEGMMSKDQAVKKLQKFFMDNQVVKFSIKHKGTSKLDDHYRIGELVTKNGTFSVTYFIKKTPNGFKIKRLSID
ncbi:MAG: DUF4783 domain-containing protein [Bacteroidota bacterium]